jgi:hypothetical protein
LEYRFRSVWKIWVKPGSKTPIGAAISKYCTLLRGSSEETTKDLRGNIEEAMGEEGGLLGGKLSILLVETLMKGKSR